MAQCILKSSGRVVPRRTAVPLTNAQLKSETEKNKRTIFDQCISKQWGTSISPTPITVDTTTDNLYDPYEDPDKPARTMPQFFDPVDDDKNQLLDQQPNYNLLIHSEVMLPHQDKLRNSNIICQ